MLEARLTIPAELESRLQNLLDENALQVRVPASLVSYGLALSVSQCV